MNEKTEESVGMVKRSKRRHGSYFPLILAEIVFTLSVFYAGLWLNLLLSIQLIISILGILLIYAINWLWPFIQLKELREIIVNSLSTTTREDLASTKDFVLSNLEVLLLIKSEIETVKVEDKKNVRDTTYAFIDRNLEILRKQIMGVLSEGGVDLDGEELDSFIGLCFDYAKDTYKGTDSHVPSEFYKIYKDYLEHHKELIDRLPPGVNPGPRILTAETSLLRKDSEDKVTMYDFEKFSKWHDDKELPLLHVEPQDAYGLIKKSGLSQEDNVDVGLWHNHYGLLFKPSADGNKVNLKMVFPGQSAYSNLEKYLEDLEKAADKLSLLVDLFGQKLADAWADFVNPNKRADRMRPFLSSILNPYKGENFDRVPRVFDAAAGLGYESIYLLQQDFDVTSNEIEKHLLDVAKKNAETEEMSLQYTTLRWQGLDEYFSGPFFDAVLVLGNSLCLVKDTIDRDCCIEQFKKILKPGGVLIVDERNFPYILENKDTILKDPIKNFRYSRNAIYCGEVVQGCPVEIKDNNVKFYYYRNHTSATFEDIIRNRVGILDMYPFKRGEMKRVLKRAGFVNIIECSDLVKRGIDENADFFIYAAYKPK
ncbi:MAG: class I SAM-dependent methyltransferase [Proteobacteria bacterium]|nr:class I SAM-dependent methyltransferase [Pseudomonadota bacterium]